MARVYIKTFPLKLRLTQQQVQFLKGAASSIGINYSELLRRILADTMRAWAEKGWYGPEPKATQETREQAEASPTSIDFLPGENGRVRILFPEGMSPAAQKDVQAALRPHVPELRKLVAPSATGKGT